MTRDAMRRLFHLGYAFNLRQLKYLEFGASLIIGSVDVPDFQRNLRRVKELVNDHETRAVCDKVLAAFPNPKAEYVVGVKVADRNQCGYMDKELMSNTAFDADAQRRSFASLRSFPSVAGQLQRQAASMGARSNPKIALWLAVFGAVTWWATRFLAVDGCLDAGGMVISQTTCEGDHEKRWNMFEKLKPLAFVIAAIAGAAAASTASWILAKVFIRRRPNAA